MSTIPRTSVTIGTSASKTAAHTAWGRVVLHDQHSLRRRRARAVSKRYGPLTALDSLSLTLRPGEILALLGVGLAGERAAGWLEVRQASPMPPAAYYFAKCASAVAFGIIIVSILTVLALTLGGVSLTPGEYARIIGLTVAGSIAFASMGLLLALVVPANAATGVFNLIYLPMSFLSGLWIPVRLLPRWLQPLSPGSPPTTSPSSWSTSSATRTAPAYSLTGLASSASPSSCSPSAGSSSAAPATTPKSAQSEVESLFVVISQRSGEICCMVPRHTVKTTHLWRTGPRRHTISAMNRRDLLATLAALSATAATGQATAHSGDDLLGTPRVYPFADLPMHKNPNGSETRPVLHGVLRTGESIEVHETTLMPGGAPNPPHAHRQSDLMFVREGTIAFEHDGKAERLGPGGIVFVSSETNHTVRNVGDTPATYFVIIIGRDTTLTPA